MDHEDRKTFENKYYKTVDKEVNFETVNYAIIEIIKPMFTDLIAVLEK